MVRNLNIPLIISLLLALLCLLLLFVGAGPGPESARSLKELWDLGHLFCFALWTWLLLTWKRRVSFWRQLVLAMLASFVVGGAIELAQSQIGREASWGDLQLDLIGSLAAVAFLSPARLQLKRSFRLGLMGAVGGLLVWALLPFGRLVTDELIAWQQFPLLSGFETPLEIDRWRGNSHRSLTRDPVFSGDGALRVDFNTDRYSGIFLRYFPADWTGYRWLSLWLYNPEPNDLRLYFRIHDQLHRLHDNAYRDRFNTSYDFPPGWTQLKVPLAQVAAAPRERSMRMDRIAAMGLFVSRLEQSKTIFLDQVELLP